MPDDGCAGGDSAADTHGEDVPGGDAPATTARAYLLDERCGLIETVLACADTVAVDFEGDGTTDRDQVVEPLRASLIRAGVFEVLPDALAECVAATGRRLAAEPVAAPPYVAVTSVGPVLRATLGDGRLVVTITAFAVERDGKSTRYVHTAPTPAEALSVEFR